MTRCSPVEAAALADELEAAFRTSFLAFWFPRAIDPDGGYAVGWDAHGRPTVDDPRSTISQARTMYLFARAARAGIDTDGMLDAAAHGLAGLRADWDDAHGGFAWSRTDPRKVTYAHAFVIFGCAELVLAGGPSDATDLAVRTFAVLDDHAHDDRRRGYHEIFDGDWSALSARDRSPIDRHRPRVKTINTHLHVLEACLHAHRAGIVPLAADRAAELVDVFTTRAVRSPYRSPMTDSWTRGWHAVPTDRVVRYGHCIELSWMLLDACAVLTDRTDVRAAAVARSAVALAEAVEEWGVDADTGGILERGQLGRRPTTRRFEGWAQAEAQLAYLWLHERTGDERWWDRFRSTWAFIRGFVVDPVVGEWHESLDADLVGHGAKGGPWASGYHGARALLDGAARLRDGYASTP